MASQKNRQNTCLIIRPLFGLLLVLLPVACNEPKMIVSGTIEAHQVTVGAEMSGRLASLHVAEGDVVESGQLLAELDCDTPNAQLAQAQALWEQSQAQLALLNAGAREQEIAIARADIEIVEQQLEMARRGATGDQTDQLEAATDAVEARLELAELTLERAESLQAAGSTTGSETDVAQTEVEVLRAEERRLHAQLDEVEGGARREELAIFESRLEQANQRLELIEEGARPEEIAAVEGQSRAAEAGVLLAQEAVERCQVTSPVGGVIDVIDYDLGELVPISASIFAIAEHGPLRVRSYAPQQLMGNLLVGDFLTVTVDGYPDHPLQARITRIADEAEFTSRNVQTPEDRMLLVFRLDLDLEPTEEIPLRPGMSLVVDFGTGGRP